MRRDVSDDPDLERTDRFRRWLHPVTVATILTVACLPLGPTVPMSGLDPSWELGLSLVHLRGIAAGPGFAFTYGPLGFLAFPNIVWLPGALLGLVYVTGAAFGFYYLVCRALNDWLPALAAAAFTVAVALVVTQSTSVPEMASAALLVWSLRLVKPDALEIRLPVWVVPALGGAAALQLLVKFGPGGVALMAGLVVAVARPPRLKNAAVLGTSFLAALVVFWLAAQQSLPNITAWLRESLQLATGYSAAMATLPGFQGTRFWLFWLVVVGVLGVRLWRLGGEVRARALPTIALVAVATWFFTKEGFTRLEQRHASIAYIGLAALMAAIPWERRRKRLALVGLAFALSAVVAASGSIGTYPTRLRQLATESRHGFTQARRIVRAAVDSSFRAGELDAARRALQPVYGLQTVAGGMRNANVHVDPWEISAVWAYQLEWRPVPAFQAYTAYTPTLDDLNADSLQSGDGPDAVLRASPYLSIGNVPAWESPDFMVALTCGYQITAETPGWQVLKRRNNVCGPPRESSQQVVRSGETVRVPAVHAADHIMVASFDYPTPVFERLTTLLIKPSRLPKVVTNGSVNAFLAATASQFHLLRVPNSFGTRHITNSGLDIRSISFPNAEGTVRVHFYEMSTR